jgi:hypothetical protein
MVLAETVAFDLDGIRRWRDRVRPKDEPVREELVFTAESEAERIEGIFRERVKRWSWRSGGGSGGRSDRLAHFQTTVMEHLEELRGGSPGPGMRGGLRFHTLSRWSGRVRVHPRVFDHCGS